MYIEARTGFSVQQQLVEALRDPDCYPHPASSVRLLETHISWVLLAGRYAYKIKKAVDMGFLDFTSLTARRFYCEEEIRLNRRLAPQLYLDVVDIGGSPERPEFGSGPAIENAVRMRRFAASRQMDRLLACRGVTPAHIDQLAATIASFHTGLPPSTAALAYGSAEAIHLPALQNFDQLAPLLNPSDIPFLARLRSASESEYAACAPLFACRRKNGWVRECHGDLHLGNIVLLKDGPTPFDCIEFNANFRWIDTMNEVAFLVMDLLDHKRPGLAFRFLNAYLELTGDHAGVKVLRYYLAYRAMVRAKTDAIRAHQEDIQPDEAKHAMAACRDYLALAETCLACRCPVLIVTYGLPGCGKTTVSQIALERLQAIRIRSDVERKRLFGLAPLQASGSQADGGIYSLDATQRTYARLHELARELLGAGFPVIVDAAFLKHAERRRFRELAQAMSVPFAILNIRAAPALLRQRIQQRAGQGSDASEADLSVLEMLYATREPLQQEELACAVEFANEGRLCDVDSLAGWNALERMALPPRKGR